MGIAVAISISGLAVQGRLDKSSRIAQERKRLPPVPLAESVRQAKPAPAGATGATCESHGANGATRETGAAGANGKTGSTGVVGKSRVLGLGP
jgi:hypothetical protein